MVSFSFGKKRRSRDTNRPGYSKKQYLSSTGSFLHPHTRRSRSVLDPVPASDLDFGRRKRRSSMYFGKKRKISTRTGCGVHRKRGMCITTNGCRWVKKSRKCVKKRAKVAKISESAPMGDADDDLGAYASEAGIEFFGRRRKSMKSRKVMRRRKSVKSRKVMRRRKSMKSRKVMRRRKSMKSMKSRKVMKSRKIPAKFRKMCKKLKIKCTKKVGSRRVYKKLSVIKRQIARKMRSMRKRAGRSRR